MPHFEVEWSAQGTTRLEADDEEEARVLVDEGVKNFDHSMFDTIDVEDVVVDSVEEKTDG